MLGGDCGGSEGRVAAIERRRGERRVMCGLDGGQVLRERERERERKLGC